VVGSSPPPHMSLSYVDVREFFNFFVDARALSVSVAGCLWIALGLFVSELLFGGRQGWGLGIPLPFLGCRIRRGSPHDCAWLPGSSGPGAWHPLAPTWVPRRGCSPRRCVCGFPLSLSGVSLFRVVLVAVRFWTSLPCVAIGQLFICAFLVLAHASQQFPVSRIFVELSLSRVLRQLQLSPCLWLSMSVVRPHVCRVTVVLLQVQLTLWLFVARMSFCSCCLILWVQFDTHC